MNGEEPLIEDIVREYNRGMWTIGYTGQSPERLKLHLENKHTFNATTLKAEGGPCDGEYYGLPWPCWGTPEMKHPGSPNLYDTTVTVAEGGLPFRANFGVEYEGKTLLSEGSWTKGSEIEDGYPEFTADLLKQLGWWNELTDAEKKAAEGKNWKTDLSGGIQRVAIKHGCAPFGNGKARCVVWNFPDPCRSTVSRFTRLATTSSRNTRRTRTASATGACRLATCRSRPRTTRRSSR